MVNIITIDPSIVCTGATVNGMPYAFASDRISMNKNRVYNKWFSFCSPVATFASTNETVGSTKIYSYVEEDKLRSYSHTAQLIKSTLDIHCQKLYPTVCLMEGYSFSSGFGPLVDLVTFGTLVRTHFLDSKDFIVIAPSSVKRLAAKLTYSPVKKGKKVEYRNNEGTAGGSFNKFDIYKALIENDELQTPWVNFLREHKEEILNLKNIPKPIEDINDSMIMYHAFEKIYKECNQDYKQTVKEIITKN